MNAPQPPALANWLLDRLGYTSQNPALAGDLLEEFHSGRSTAWYWRQTLMVIATGTIRNAVGLQPRLIACFIGFAAQAPLAYGLWRIHALATIHRWVWVILLPLLLLNAAIKLLAVMNVSAGGRKHLIRLLAPRQQLTLPLAAFQASAGYLSIYCISAL